MKSFYLLSLLFFLIAPTSSYAKIYIDITKTSEKSFPIAIVPPYVDSKSADLAQHASTFTDVLHKDLRLMGFFRLIPQSAFIEDASKKSLTDTTIDFPSWAVLDALALVKGSITKREAQLVFEIRLFDVLLKKELIGKRYTGTSDKVEFIAHSFANEIMKILTGESGIFHTKIAYVANQSGNKEIYMIDFNGANREAITQDRSIALSPTFDTNGKSLFYTSFKGEQSSQLWKYDFETKTRRKLTNFPGMVIGVSHDPITGALATTLTKDGNSEIYLLTKNGEIEKRLTREPNIDVSPSFSPEGRELVFISDRSGHPQVHRMDRDARSVQRLSFRGLNNTSPAWSPTGDKIVFAGMDTDGHFDIFTMNPDGSQMVRLTYDSRNNEEPKWSPDGRFIVFASNRSGRYQIYVMRADGSQQTQVTFDPWNNTMPTWGPIP